MNPLRSFLYYYRTLGPYWWLRCAIENAWITINEFRRAGCRKLAGE